MSITVGTQLGSHQITGLLGKGGMGEVYRAHDSKLKREVAIKILPEEFSRDPDRVSRFQREAEVLASLNHPNIAAIYNFEQAGGMRFLVLELVEGETLADRMEHGPIPIDESLAMAKQIADALEAAHEKDIVHRDLKPANVKITPDGRLKVLDFGLAKRSVFAEVDIETSTGAHSNTEFSVEESLKMSEDVPTRRKEKYRMTATVPSTSDRVGKIESTVRTNAAQAEADRRLTPQAMAALHDAGIMRTWVPKTYGGLEMDPIPALKIFEEIARIDSAAGWIASNSSIIAFLCQIINDQGSAEMFSDPRTLVAGGWFPPGKAVPVQGGYRLTGQWAFASGCNYANWLTSHVVIMDGDTPRLDANGNPVSMITFFRASEAEILDNWHTLGMRGTGSHDVRVDNVFVPASRCFVLSPVDRPASAFKGPLYRFGFWMAPAPIATVCLGIARAALDDLIELAKRKTPSYTQTPLGDRPVVQDRIARARALIDAGRHYLYGAYGEAWEYVQSGRRIELAQGMPLALAGSFAVDAACQAVDLVHASAGTTAIRNENRFQQYFRDVHTASQHAFASISRFESAGKVMLGRQSDWAFYYL